MCDLLARWREWQQAPAFKWHARGAELCDALRRLLRDAEPPPLRVGCRASLRRLISAPGLNGEEVQLVSWHEPSKRWVIQRAVRSHNRWPDNDQMRVCAQNLVACRAGFHFRLHFHFSQCEDAANSGGSPQSVCGTGDLIGSIIGHLTDIGDLSRASQVDRTFARAAAPAIAAACRARYLRGLEPFEGCVELVSPKSAEVLPSLCRKLEQLAEVVEPRGGSLSAYVVSGPVLHVGQAKDLSCAYRSMQMIISHMLQAGERFWPGAREAFIDVAELREMPGGCNIALPSVRRLRRTLESAWMDGYDPAGAKHFEMQTATAPPREWGQNNGSVQGGQSIRAWGRRVEDDYIRTSCNKCGIRFLVPLASIPRASVPDSAPDVTISCALCERPVHKPARSEESTDAAPTKDSKTEVEPETTTASEPKHVKCGNGIGVGKRILEYAGRPEEQPNLKLVGATDMWAMMRWAGARAQVHDFIDGALDTEKRSCALLFDWVWDHLCRHSVQPIGDGLGVRRCRCAPIFLQWAGHAVCVVGAVRRQLSRLEPIERHLLIFNPETWTEVLYDALREPEPMDPPAAQPKWWTMVAWCADREGTKRITHNEAMNCKDKTRGPGGDTGPYQTLIIPNGWITNEDERHLGLSPEDACTQHVGNHPAVEFPASWKKCNWKRIAEAKALYELTLHRFHDMGYKSEHVMDELESTEDWEEKTTILEAYMIEHEKQQLRKERLPTS